MKFRVQESTKKKSRAGGMDVCVICCTVKDKGICQDDQDKETSTEKVQRENK